MAGPWFTVQRSSDSQWHVLDRIWISNGHETTHGTVELRIEFAPHDDEATGVDVAHR